MVYIVWILGALSTGLAAAMTLHPPKAKEKRKKGIYWTALVLLTFAGLIVAIYQKRDQDAKDSEQAKLEKDLRASNKTLADEVHSFGSKLPTPNRHLTTEQRATLVSELRSMGTYDLVIRHAQTSSELDEYMSEIEAALKEAGWKYKEPAAYPILQKDAQGIHILIKNKDRPPAVANGLFTAFAHAGQSPSGQPYELVPTENDVELYVGYQ